MTARNEFDVLRKAMADAYAKDARTLKTRMAQQPPYNSTKLSPEEESLLYQFPERAFPGLPIPREQARIQLKDQMGAAEYLAFIKRNAGG